MIVDNLISTGQQYFECPFDLSIIDAYGHDDDVWIYGCIDAPSWMPAGSCWSEEIFGDMECGMSVCCRDGDRWEYEQ